MSPSPESAALPTLNDPVGWLQVVVLAVGAYVASSVVGPLNAIVAALVLGAVAANVSPVAHRSDAVATFMLKRVLKVAIVLLGAGVNASVLTQMSWRVLGVLAVTILVALLVAQLVGRALGLSGDTALLIGVGTAICGASAIAAVAPLLHTKKDAVGVALGTIFVFNAVALVLFPVIAFTSGMDPSVFGMWAGMAVHDTASAVATGFAYSPHAGETATLIKLTRTLFLIPLVVAVAVAVSRADAKTSHVSIRRSVIRTFPLFVVGFVAAVAAHTTGLLGDQGGTIASGGRLLLIGVVVAIGLSLNFGKIRTVGVGLGVTGLASSVAVAAAGYGLITLVL